MRADVPPVCYLYSLPFGCAGIRSIRISPKTYFRLEGYDPHQQLFPDRILFTRFLCRIPHIAPSHLNPYLFLIIHPILFFIVLFSTARKADVFALTNHYISSPHNLQLHWPMSKYKEVHSFIPSHLSSRARRTRSVNTNLSWAT